MWLRRLAAVGDEQCCGETPQPRLKCGGETGDTPATLCKQTNRFELLANH